MADITTQLKTAYDNAHPVLREALLSDSFAKTLADIAAKRKLRVDESAHLEDVVSLTLLGIDEAKNLPVNLKNGMADRSDDELWSVAEDVDSLILKPLREKIIAGNKAPEAAEAPIQVALAPVPIPLKTPVQAAPATPVMGIQRTMPQDIMESKLKTITHSPMEMPNSGGEEAKTPEEKYGGVDPYREPIN